jgi:hypothetical protein
VRSTGATRQQREGRRADMSVGHGDNEVAAGWRSGWRGARGKGQWGREAGPGKGRATCGGEGSKRWRQGGTGAAVSGTDNQQQRS